jgi:hypothetical protein
MEQFIREQNIRLLLKALDGESDPERRQMLEMLLAQWQGKIASEAKQELSADNGRAP